MLLKVGELAKTAGLTVRTLHHYDAIGLLSPSARSEGGYRLYNRDDVARLHTIQALRQMGLRLNDIAGFLEQPEQSLSAVVRQQIAGLDRTIAEASDLRTRLQLLQVRLESGNEPGMAEWASTFELMATYGKYFAPAELKQIIDNWKETKPDWSMLIRDIRKCMQRSVDPNSLELQPLARRWMTLNKQWLGADYDLIERWDRMYESEPLVRNGGEVSPELWDYIKPAVKLRLATLVRYFSTDDLMQWQEQPREWAALEKKIRAAIRHKVPPESPSAQALLKVLETLIDRTVNHDPVQRQKLVDAVRENEVLRAGTVLSGAAQQYIYAIRQAQARAG